MDLFAQTQKGKRWTVEEREELLRVMRGRKADEIDEIFAVLLDSHFHRSMPPKSWRRVVRECERLKLEAQQTAEPILIPFDEALNEVIEEFEKIRQWSGNAIERMVALMRYRNE